MAEPLRFSSFKARAPWWGGDLQTLRNALVGRSAVLSPWPARALRLALDDGSGDCLRALWHQPREDHRRPPVVLLHGLCGCEDSHYIRTSARFFLLAGYPVLRLNLRGAGAGRPLARGHYHAGRSEDLAAALRALQRELPGLSGRDLLLLGFSLGANMLLKFLGEDGHDLPVRAAVSVSAPLDLKRTQLAFMAPRNALYHAWLLRLMKREALATPGGLEAPYARAAVGARSVYEFDDKLVAPRNGFAGAEDYYAHCSAAIYLDGITLPTLILQAADDPWIPAAIYQDIADSGLNSSLRLELFSGGGHVGFHEAGALAPLHDRRALRFFTTALG